ncbi:protein rogdi homolog [Halichondria panicea]|uniref:protein rogdi homolog n=1 Tax=Halichondria panicea TaxID=6063 RepID=UPI00312B7A73
MDSAELLKEWEWLVRTELTAKLEAIDRHLEECSKKLSPFPIAGAEIRPVLLSSQHQGDNVLCTVTVDGDRISRAELNVRAPGKGGRSLRTTIKEQSPWKLKQVQDSVNHFQRVRDLYASLKSCGHSSQSCLRGCLEGLLGALLQTEAALTLPPNTTAQHIFNNNQKSVLKPELPEDVALYFHISSSLLVLTVLAVTARGGVREMKDIESNSWMGALFEHGSVIYEVTGQLRVSASVPWLAAVLALLRQSLELTQDLLDKVKVFDGVSSV